MRYSLDVGGEIKISVSGKPTKLTGETDECIQPICHEGGGRLDVQMKHECHLLNAKIFSDLLQAIAQALR